MEQNFKDITKKLKAKDYRLTDIRKSVINILSDNKGHLSINDIVEKLKQESNETINIASIYNTIDLLMKEHIIHADIFEGKQKVYELSKNPTHIICNYCNKIVHLPSSKGEKESIPVLNLEQLEKLTSENNFSFSDYKLEIHGICKNCNDETKK